jgi:hypothetical protein
VQPHIKAGECADFQAPQKLGPHCQGRPPVFASECGRERLWEHAAIREINAGRLRAGRIPGSICNRHGGNGIREISTGYLQLSSVPPRRNRCAGLKTSASRSCRPRASPQSAALVEETAMAAQSMQDQAKALSELVQVFKLAHA